MSRQLRRALAVVVTMTALLAAAVAQAAGPVKGAKYTGTTARDSQPISFKVSTSGKSVTVSIAFAPMYCQGGGAGTVQVTKPAAISHSGSFKSTIAYEFAPEHKITSKLYVSGKFSGNKVKGTARSEFLLAKQCDGSTSFSASATAKTARAAAASKLSVTKRVWEIGEANNVHEVASGGKFEYCETEPVTGMTPVIGYAHAPVGKSYQVKLAAPAASGSIPAGAKTKLTKASGHTDLTFAAPSFSGHEIAGGSYKFSLLVAGKTVASMSLTLVPTQSKC
jgi:hypothetical protein